MFRTRVIDVLESIDDDAHPSDVVRSMGQAGVIEDRWTSNDSTLGVALIGAVAADGRFDASVALGLHVEASLRILRRFARAELRPMVELALRGEALVCIATTEREAGSDLAAVTTSVEQAAGGWRLRGMKEYVSLSTCADLMLVLGRTGVGDRSRTTLVAVPRTGFEVVQTHRMVGASRLDTSRVVIDAVVPGSHVLGVPGMGTAILGHGLTGERLAIVAQVLATCDLALSLAVTRAHRRRQHGEALWDHQAIRLRLAELQAEHAALAAHLSVLAGRDRLEPRAVAGLKLVTARFGERCLSECLQVFGGLGYVETATPIGRLWRSVRLGRIGGGTDEVMAEMVAQGMVADDTIYERFVLDVGPDDQGGGG